MKLDEESALRYRLECAAEAALLEAIERWHALVEDEDWSGPDEPVIAREWAAITRLYLAWVSISDRTDGEDFFTRRFGEITYRREVEHRARRRAA